MPFFDCKALSPKDELANAFQRTESDKLSKFGSLEGRAVCLLKVLNHTASLVLKPLFYLAIGIGFLVMTQAGFKGQLNTPQLQNNPATKQLRVLEKNPEFKTRMVNMGKNLVLTAPVAILSQTIQIAKAALGILHPGIYFKTDKLSPLLHRLGVVAQYVGCDHIIVQELNKGSKALDLYGVSKAYIQAEYARNLRVIAQKLEDPNIPDSRKLSVLSMLNPIDGLDNKSGIKACIAGLGRTLQQMRAAIDVPEHPSCVIPHLLEQFKGDIFEKMVLDAEGEQNASVPVWNAIIKRLGYDEAHRGTALISAIGADVGLPKEIIALAKQDPLTGRGVQLSNTERNALLTEFNTRNNRASQIKVLLTRINSDVTDGSPGLKAFRIKVIQALANGVTPDMLSGAKLTEGDEVQYIVVKYQMNKGQGDVREAGFDDLNADAIEYLLDHGSDSFWATVSAA